MPSSGFQSLTSPIPGRTVPELGRNELRVMDSPLVLNSIIDAIAQGVEQCRSAGFLQLDTVPEIQVERPANRQHGDFATSLPLRLARATRINPLTSPKP